MDELRVAVVDTGPIWRYIAANEWVTDFDLRAWAQQQGMGADRVNAALALLHGAGLAFQFDDTPLPPPPPEVQELTLTQASVNGDCVALVYIRSLDTSSVPDDGDYRVMVGGDVLAVQQIDVVGSVVMLDLQHGVTASQSVTLSYTPGANPVKDAAGNAALPLTDMPVQNTSPLSALSVSQLRKRAQELDIEGRSNMDKEALVEAVQKAEK